MNEATYLETAVEAVRRAGALQMAHFGRRDMHIDKKAASGAQRDSIDLVTEVDVAVERMFRALIAERFPDHQVLAEEMGGSSTIPAGPCWVFDPIDGTTNYAHGLPIFCASAALEIGGVAEVGAIFDPTRDELFTAARGAGAFLNGVPIHASETADLIDAMVVTGFPYDVHVRVDELLALFGAFLGRARAVRRLGSAAIDLCYVAAGRMDGFWEIDLKPWDVAAGALILEEAGGRTTQMDGSPFQSRRGHILGTNGRLHEAMLQVIRDVRESPSRRTR